MIKNKNAEEESNKPPPPDPSVFRGQSGTDCQCSSVVECGENDRFLLLTADGDGRVKLWNGETKMKCLSHTIGQSLNHGYAHHIQRLMVTGNFALLAGIDPDEVDLWYLGIYIDAFEWVEITNTRGMSQYADGGWIATKPYVSSANYMKKMGDYCDQCHYNPKTKTDDDSCPFNALYWNFFDSQRDKLHSNFRLGMVYRTYDKMNATVKAGIREKAQSLFNNINEL